MRSAALFFRLLQPLLVMAFAVTVAVPVIVGAVIPLLIVFWTIGLVPMMIFRELREHLGVTMAGYLIWGLLLPILSVSASAVSMALAFAAVLHLDTSGWPELDIIMSAARQMMPLLAPVAMVTGIIGVSSTLVFGCLDIPWRLKQIAQVSALPRSRVRSAAIGLAEFEGTVQATDADVDITKPGTRTARPFYLNDGTGRILIDPADAAVRQRAQTGESLKLNEIEEGIRAGDRVYVIGYVQPREDAAPDALDSDSLVVRPLRQTLVASPVGALLFTRNRQPGDRTASNIFIVDKGTEHNVTLRLRLVLWDYCIYIAAYLGASFWLVLAAWPRLPAGISTWILPGA